MSISNGQVSVGDNATEIHTASGGPSGAKVMVKNVGSADVFLGDASVTTNDGYKLAVGDVLPVDLSEGEGLYGIVSSGSETVHKLVTGE